MKDLWIGIFDWITGFSNENNTGEEVDL